MANYDVSEVELFLKHHGPLLIERLSKHASMWRRLGGALGFQQSDLDNIQCCLPLLNDSPFSFMERLVQEWLERKYPHLASPTLANLLKALNSHAVGLGTLAAQIRDAILQYKIQTTSAAKVFEIAILSEHDQETKIVMFDHDVIIVDENESVHLKVKTSNEIQSFEWESVGLVPINDKLYSGIRQSTLKIPKVDTDMDGSQYYFSIKSSQLDACKHSQLEPSKRPSKRPELDLFGERLSLAKSKMSQNTMKSTPVTMRVNSPQLDHFKVSLDPIYLAEPEVPQDTWPPVSSKTHINLALIKQQKINYGTEYARLTIRGDMDDILHHKEEIKYENVFDGLRSGSLLLIEGRPGSGKTTFVHKITRDWAASEVRGPIRLILLISLRVLNSWKEPVALSDILQLLDFQESETVLKERKGKGLCFIFDGLDEFSPLDGQNSIVYKIICKKYLAQSIVIVASRPAALVKLRQRANKIIEVIGFRKDQILEYVENYPFSNSTKIVQLKEYLLSHPNVLHMCYLPIHAAMVAFLFEVMGKVPRTETEIYTHFTRFTLMRSLSKHKEQGELEHVNMNELSGEERSLFDTICELALSKTVMNKQVLDEDEVKLCLQHKDGLDLSLGLITVDRTAGLYGFKNIYTFLHLTYQEYLAACHIATLSDKDQHKLIKQYGNTDHMKVVWKFYCGLIKFAGHEYKIKVLFDAKVVISLFDIQCAYESQQELFCASLIKKMGTQILLEHKYLTTPDFTALGYFLANSVRPISLSLNYCNMNSEAVYRLLKETEERPLHLSNFHFVSHDCDLESITKLLSQQNSLKYLKITQSTLSSHSFSDTVQNISTESALSPHQQPNLNVSYSYSDKESTQSALLPRNLDDSSLSPHQHANLSFSDTETIQSALSPRQQPNLDDSSFSDTESVQPALSPHQCANLDDSETESTQSALSPHECANLDDSDTESTQSALSPHECANLDDSDTESTQSALSEVPNDLSQKELTLFSHANVDDFSLSDTGLVGSDVLQVFSNASLDDGGFSDIVSTSLLNINEFKLTNIQIGPKTLTNVLQFCKELKSLTLNTSIKKNDFEILLTGLSGTTKLEMMSCSTPADELNKVAYYIDITRVGANSNAENVALSAPPQQNSMLYVQGDFHDYLQTLRVVCDGAALPNDELLDSCKYWPRVKTLALYQQGSCSYHRASVIGTDVSDFSALEKLILRSVRIDEAIALLATKLNYCTKLKELDLSNNHIEIPEEFMAILNSLKYCSNIQKVNLNHTILNSDVAHVLASCLQHWPKLQELHLRNCCMHENAARAIASNLGYCTELTIVECGGFNCISDETVQLIKSNLKSQSKCILI